MGRRDNIRPMGILPTIAYWAIPATILYVSHYILVPMLIKRTGQPYLVGYLIAWVSTMVFFFIAALAAYRLEGNPFRLTTVTERYRLGGMSRQDWIWALGILGFVIISYFGLAFTSGWLAQWSFLAPHPVFPPEFGPEGAAARASGTFMGMTDHGLGLGCCSVSLRMDSQYLWRGVVVPRLHSSSTIESIWQARLDR